MPARVDPLGWTQAETDVADVMIWLRSNHGRELSYADIAAGVGMKTATGYGGPSGPSGSSG